MTKFKDRYVLGEGYPHKYYDAVGVRSSRDFAGPLDLKWPKEFRSEGLPKYRLVLERVEEKG